MKDESIMWTEIFINCTDAFTILPIQEVEQQKEQLFIVVVPKNI